MFSAWQKASEKPRYSIFKPALEAAMAKLDEYYRRTAESDAHIIAMGTLYFLLLFLMSCIIEIQYSTQGRSSDTLLRIGMLSSRTMSRRWFRKRCVLSYVSFFVKFK
jgi:hypothetical protein